MPDLAVQVQVQTPTGRVTITLDEFRRQEDLVRAAMTRLGGAGTHQGVLGYIELFGFIDPAAHGHPYGRNVWNGMAHLWAGYVFQYRMAGAEILVGWFLCPEPFSQANAGRPAQAGDTRWYPAFFASWGEDSVTMACQAILLLGSRPWHIHPTRMHNTRPWHAVLNQLCSDDDLEANGFILL